VKFKVGDKVRAIRGVPEELIGTVGAKLAFEWLVEDAPREQRENAPVEPTATKARS
jgi:hypothetical protein